MKAAQDIAKALPSDPQGVTLQAEVLARQGQAGAAIALLKSAQAANPSERLVLKQVEIYMNARAPTRAIPVLVDWLKGHPTSFGPGIVLAQIYGQMGNFDAALAQYVALEKQRPSNVIVLNNLAYLYDRKHDPRAKAYAMTAYRLAGDSPQVADTLGWILARNGEAKNAVGYLKAANQAAPKDPAIGYHLAFALSKDNQPAPARALLQQVLASNPAFDGRAEAEALLKQLQAR